MASPVADSYSVASGGTIYAGRALPLPSWLSSAAAHEVVNVASSTPSGASGLSPAVAGSMGSQSGMVNAWGGGWVYDGKFYIHGGGHTDYGGNETGWIDLTQDSPAWDLLAERTAVGDIVGGSNYYNDGKPTSRHTYYAMWAYNDAGTPKMLRLNGNMGFAYNGIPPNTADVRTVNIDALNLSDGSWETAYATMPRITGSETSSAQDPSTGDIYVWRGQDNIIEKFDVSAGTAAQVADLTGTEGLGGACVVDAVNGRLIRFGGAASSGAVYWPVAGGSKTTYTMTGAAAAAVNALTEGGMGIAHDTLRNVAYIYTDAPVVYKVDLNTDVATTVTTTGETIGAPTNGWWGRVKYMPEIDSVVSLANWTSPVQVMRLG